jgi:hypothetical protein
MSIKSLAQKCGAFFMPAASAINNENNHEQGSHEDKNVHV